jgi:hypothetical protein
MVVEVPFHGIAFAKEEETTQSGKTKRITHKRP